MSFQNLISQVLGHAAQNVSTNDPITDRMLHFFARLQSQAFGPWSSIARSGMTCAVRFRPQGAPTVLHCSNPAIGGCIACGQPTCLEHALVSASGEIVCRGCVDDVRIRAGRHPGARSGHVGPSPESGAGSASSAVEEHDKLRRMFLRRLKLKGSPSASQINAAYRKLAVQHHPDKFPSEKFSARRRRAEERKFKELSEAKDWLLSDLERRAA